MLWLSFQYISNQILDIQVIAIFIVRQWVKKLYACHRSFIEQKVSIYEISLVKFTP